MRCPFCRNSETLVKDSRDSEEGRVVRRRRQCESCKARFTTFERVQIRDLIVIKRSGVKKAFDSEKIHKSIATAVRKRNISEQQINAVTENIVRELELSNSREISTRKIGELIMQKLADIDQVAYVRFASVYKDFSTVQDFTKFASKIKK